MTRTRVSIGLLCLLGFVACTSSEELPAVDAGVGDANPDALVEGGGALQGTMQCGEVPVATAACAACADESCCQAGEACAANPECMALRACIGSCPADDAACAEACGDAHPDGAADNAVLAACRMRWCGVECFQSTAGSCGFQFPGACNECAQSMCCEVGWLSNTQPSFWRYQACAATCADAACFDACASAEPEGRDYYMAFIGCLGTHCASDCGVDPPATCGAYYDANCGPCVAEHCCEESTACLTDPACRLLHSCVQDCGGDQDCIADCEADHPGAVAAFESYRGCLESACGGLCP
ncbi:MAG: hypothetical protein ACOC1F_00030 [Myxococcota bacterium]